MVSLVGRPRTSLGRSERVMHFRASLQQWSVGRRLRKGFPHNGRCPEIQGGNRQTAPGFSPVASGELLHAQEQSSVEQLAGTETHSQTCGLCAPARASPASLPAAGRLLLPPPTSPPPRRYLSLRGTRRARPRLRRVRALHAGSLANQHGARGAAAREPKPGRLLPWRAEPDRAEPSQTEPGAQSAGGGGAEPR